MGFSEEFKAIARDRNGEAAKARLFARARDGQNLTLHSSMASAATDGAWSNSSNIIRSTDPTERQYGSDGVFLYKWENSAGASTNEYLGQSVGVLHGRVVASVEVSEEDAARVAIRLYDETIDDYFAAEFDFVAGVPVEDEASRVLAYKAGVIQGVDGSGIVHRIYLVADLPSSGRDGNSFSIRIYPAEGSSVEGVGSVVGNASVETQRDAPRRYTRTTTAALENQPGELVELTSGEAMLRANPVTRKREHRFGVVQPQSWQSEITNASDEIFGMDLAEAWVALRVGFPEADVWETVAQGRIRKISVSTDARITIEARDLLFDVLKSALPRDMHWGAEGWASAMKVYTKDADSEDFINDRDGDGADETLPVANEANCLDERIRLVFVSATTYEVRYEDGSVDDNGGAFYSISSDETIPNSSAAAAVTIPAAGWSSDTGAYSSGDTFFFDTSSGMASSDLTPIFAIYNLLTGDYAPKVYDVMSGVWYASPFENASAVIASATNFLSHEIGGTWKEGTSVLELIQDALKIVHGSLFPTPDGRLGLYVLEPSTASAEVLNGDPDRGPVDIMKATYVDDADETYNRVVYRYKSLGTEVDSFYEAVDENSPFSDDLVEEVEIGWAVSPLAIQSSANKFISRFRGIRRHWTIYANLTGAVVEMARAISIYEPALGADGVKTDVVTSVLNIAGNTSEIHAYTERVAYADYAVVGISVVGGDDLVW